jgi:hypothetical protein
MTWVHRTLICPTAHVALARALSEGLAGASGALMYSTPLSADGKLPASHWISAGLVQEQYAELMADPDALLAACAAAGVTVNETAVRAMLAASVIRADENPHAVIAELGLQMAAGEDA